MSTVYQCQCGAKIRLPDKRGTTRLRCPKCKVGIALSVNARVLEPSQLGSGQGDAVCPICQTGIDAEEIVVTCTRCSQIHHRECWAEVGGCGTYGCEEAPAAEKSEAEARPALTAWGDTKDCPYCGETIKAIALKCRFCDAEFDSVDPMTVRDVARQAERRQSDRQLRINVTVLLVISILGCLAPLMVIIAPIWFLPKRKTFAKQSPVYLVMGYTSIGISVIYSVLILFFMIFG